MANSSSALSRSLNMANTLIIAFIDISAYPLGTLISAITKILDHHYANIEYIKVRYNTNKSIRHRHLFGIAGWNMIVNPKDWCRASFSFCPKLPSVK